MNVAELSCLRCYSRCCADPTHPPDATLFNALLGRSGWSCVFACGKDRCPSGLKIGFLGSDIAHVVESIQGGLHVPRVRDPGGHSPPVHSL